MDGGHNGMLGLMFYVKPDINIGNNVFKVDLGASLICKLGTLTVTASSLGCLAVWLMGPIGRRGRVLGHHLGNLGLAGDFKWC